MASSDAISRQTFRIIDASLNRIGEGLRFLKNQAHLLLNNTTLNQQLKNVRHEFMTNNWISNQCLL